MKTLDSDKKASKPAAPAAASAAEKIDFSNVKIEPILHEMVDFDTFAKADYRAVKILACEAVPKSKKLLKFTWNVNCSKFVLNGFHDSLKSVDEMDCRTYGGEEHKNNVLEGHEKHENKATENTLYR